MFLTVNKDVLTMLMTSLARDASALGSIEVEVEVLLKKCNSDLKKNPMTATAKMGDIYFSEKRRHSIYLLM